MCDENIAVSIRTLSQMSSIIPNSLEKLKLTSLAAGLVAGFTTDCNFGADINLSKGYDQQMSNRVNTLRSVIGSHIVVNKTWLELGARTVCTVRNVFITGRRHPLNTSKNLFSLITSVEYQQANGANANLINQALDVLRKYSIDYENFFYRLVEEATEVGIATTLDKYAELITKSAVRINDSGERLPILDEDSISKVVSVFAGAILGYIYSIPTTLVDFEEYYRNNAYPAIGGDVNDLIEKRRISSEHLFAAFRSVLETRYELAYEPNAVIRGVLVMCSVNKLLPDDVLKALDDCNREEYVDYVINMVKNVYDVRRDALERNVMHELQYLPITTNPIADLVKVETNEEIVATIEQGAG